MKFTAKGRYGVRAMIELALCGGTAPMSAKSVSLSQQISADYLEQIFRQLRRHGLVKSVRGPAGGFVLAKPAAEISVWDIISALGEPFQIAPCVDQAEKKAASKNCRLRSSCAAHRLWLNVADELKSKLRRTTLAAIIEPRP